MIDRRFASGRGAAPQMVAGGGLLALGSLLYMAAGLADLPLLLVAGALAAGAGSAAFTTATNTELAHSIPTTRRAEAMGYFGIAQTIGTGLGAGSSFFLFTTFGIPAPFAVGAALYAMGILLGSRAGAGGRVAAEHVPSAGFAIERSALPAALAVWGLVIGQSSSTAFVQLLGIERGVTNPGVYYFAHAVSAVVLRVFGGRIADRYGRLTVIVPGLLMHSAGLVLLSQARSTEMIALAGLLVGIGFAGALSTLQALTVDLARPNKRGSALAMFWAATDVGVITGVLLGGQLAAAFGYSGLFLITSLGPAAAAIGLAVWWAARRRSGQF
jgi:MFS family permease